MSGRAAIAVSALLLAAYCLFPNARLDFTRFNAHDAESYIALSRSILEGRGYTRSLMGISTCRTSPGRRVCR